MLLAFAIAVPAAWILRTHTSNPSPYVGFEQRHVKALGEAEIADLKAGRGMGFALAAELNGYPGPLHVLELAGQIGLDADARQRVERIFADMRAAAIVQGETLISAEERLDALFKSGRASEAELAEAVASAAIARGELRRIHLSAHVAMRSLLSADQVAAYNKHRGYGGGHGHGGHGAGHGG
jgi:Spy/CpxP family protein refolding chaperone